MTRKLAIGIIGLALLVIFSVASAKISPYIEDPAAEWGDLESPFLVWNATAVVAHYGRLGTYGDMDAFSFEFNSNVENWPIELAVPICGSHFKDVYPSAALVGPGLEIPAEGSLPFELPEGMGAQIFVNEHNDSRSGSDNMFAIDAYRPSTFQTDIPEAGMYTLVIWEPEGNVGAYVVGTGLNYDQFEPRTDSAIDAAFNELFSGLWMQQDCNAPVAAQSCPLTVNEGGTLADIPQTVERAKVGEGFVLTGDVRDATTCLPIEDAQVTYWLVNESGEYDADHEGMASTNAQGAYRIESNRPGSYGPEAHIHLAVSAPGYETVITVYILQSNDESSANFLLALNPE
ncbi:MAG: hypothetical protein K8L97_27910 [Anaerolineae bacterium]|nr:hypothetical protein [Anaerolineae bacterium]